MKGYFVGVRVNREFGDWIWVLVANIFNYRDISCFWNRFWYESLYLLLLLFWVKLRSFWLFEVLCRSLKEVTLISMDLGCFFVIGSYLELGYVLFFCVR